MKFSWFLALRYLKPKRTFISIITVISVLGVALGVCVMLVVIAVMTGFEKRMKEEFLKAQPALTLTYDRESALGVLDEEEETQTWRELLENLKKHPEVVSCSPTVTVAVALEKKATEEEEQFLAESGGKSRWTQALIIGVDPNDEAQMERLRKRMAERGSGEFEIAGDNIVAGLDLANSLGGTFPLIIGESAVNVYGPAFLSGYHEYYNEIRRAGDDPEKRREAEERERDLPLPEEYTLRGVFDDPRMNGVAFVSLKNAQTLAGLGRNVDGIAVELKDPYRAGEVALELRDALPPFWRSETWMQRNSELFQAVDVERGMMYLILSIISVVAAFCIMNTMITMAVQKRREIGMMRALGARASQILGLFVCKGLVVATLGVSLGVAGGLAILAFRNDLRTWLSEALGIGVFPESVYGLRELPADLRLVDALVICGLAFVFCTLAAAPPAWMMSRMDPAKALRTDR